MTNSTETTYQVVISDEGRYSIWPNYKQIPWGWRADGIIGNRKVCLDHIAEVWTDMRPLRLQQAMSQQIDAQTTGQSAAQSESQLT
ncbi:MAG: MbtH family NRPS accessory protein [Cyanobacteria bacterium P01_D01_bin.105]